MTESRRSDVAPGERRTHWLVIVLAVATGSMFLTIFLQVTNPRILVSWHGFLHTAIANRFPGSFRSPENPFFAGERLPYYWFHHYVATALGRTLDLHPIRVFQIITACGFLLLWISAGAIGVYRFRSLKAGLLIGFLALAGVNPLGPVIAVGKHLVQGTRLFNADPPVSAIDTVFVTEHESSDSLTHPLLSALYVTGDWRRGLNIPWYLDNSSRGIALALIFALVFVFLGRPVGGTGVLSASAIAAVMTALNPLIGLAAVGSLLAASVAVALLNRIRSGTPILRPVPWELRFAVAAALGAAAASPTYYHLFLVGGSSATVLSFSKVMLRAVALALNVIVLLPMAFWGSFRASDSLRNQSRILVIAACGLLLIVPLIALSDDTEHNFANTAQCLLVVPAVAWTVKKRVSRGTDMLIAGLFLPVAAATLASYIGRPSLPIALDRAAMHRTSDDALDRLYQWIREATPRDAVFIIDPARPVKMSGNVSELPAFTGRTLFVDGASYLTTPHRDFARRCDMAARLLQGSAMSEQDAAYLAGLHRPLYLLTHQATQTEVVDRLVQKYGTPLFHEGFVGAFDLAPLTKDRAPR